MQQFFEEITFASLQYRNLVYTYSGKVEITITEFQESLPSV